jgi:serine/threonine protein kinase
MSNTLLKTGFSSVILGKSHYNNFITTSRDDLIKITKRQDNHDEFRWLNRVREIPNYKDYFSIPDEISYVIKPGEKFYEHVKELTKDHQMTIFTGELECYFINYAGERDIQDSIADTVYKKDTTIWRNYGDILQMAKAVMTGLSFLHERKMCHLDIKPENIVMEGCRKHFRIIDFGFSSAEPFEDFIKAPRGTPGYFPKNMIQDPPSPWLPKMKANDMYNGSDGKIPMERDYKMVYRLDSFSFGRTLHFLRFIVGDNEPDTCRDCRCLPHSDQLDALIADLLEDDVHQRATITDCLNNYFTNASRATTGWAFW